MEENRAFVDGAKARALFTVRPGFCVCPGRGFRFLAITALVLTAGVLSAADYAWDTCDSLVGHYGMNDNANSLAVTDLTGTYNGTFSGGGFTSAHHAAGRVGTGALTFDGVNDYVNCGNQVVNGVLDGDFTLCVWFRQTAQTMPTELNGDRVILCNHKANNQIYPGVRITYWSDRRLMAWVYFQDGTYWHRFSTNAIVDNEWHFAVLQRQGTTFRFFLDSATPFGPSTDPKYSQDISSTNSFALGCYYVIGRSNYFQGDIDDVRVYSRALTAAEIGALFNAGHGTEACSGIVVEPARSFILY